MAAGRHLGFCYRSKVALWQVADCPCLQSCQILWLYLNRQLSYCILWKNSKWRRPPFWICIWQFWTTRECMAKIRVFAQTPQWTWVSQQIWCQLNFYFSRYCDFKILQIWLKTPIQAPKIDVFWGKNKKRVAPNVRPKLLCLPRHPRWTDLYRILRVGSCPRICFLVLSFREIGRKMWELWWSKFPSPVEKAHCLCNSLLLLQKPW